MTRDERYLLGHGDQEWERLIHQHEVWRHTLLDALPRLGIGEGARILEAGCGNGALLADLAEVTGPEGRAVGVELDPGAAEGARRFATESRAWVEVRQGDLFELDQVLEDEPVFDLVVSRWVLSFLSKPKEAVASLVDRLEPGGLLLIQDYDYDGIRVEPGAPFFERLFRVLMPRAYGLHGGDPYIACKLPRIYAELGIELVELDPHCQAGPLDCPAAQWAERFFRQHAPNLVEQGALSEVEAEEMLAAWDEAHATPGAVFFSPLVVNVVGRKPA